MKIFSVFAGKDKNSPFLSSKEKAYFDLEEENKIQQKLLEKVCQTLKFISRKEKKIEELVKIGLGWIEKIQEEEYTEDSNNLEDFLNEIQETFKEIQKFLEEESDE